MAVLPAAAAPACWSEEQGLPLFWSLATRPDDYTTAFGDLFALGPPTDLLAAVVTAGVHAWKCARDDVVRLLDGLCAAGDADYFVEKTPIMYHPPGWPDEYVARSARFDSATVLCCRRDVRDTWASSCRVFPHCEQQFTWPAFALAWHDYYDEAVRRGWTIVDHAAAAADPQGVLDAICDQHFAGARIDADPFRRAVGVSPPVE